MQELQAREIDGAIAEGPHHHVLEDTHGGLSQTLAVSTIPEAGEQSHIKSCCVKWSSNSILCPQTCKKALLVLTYSL